MTMKAFAAQKVVIEIPIQINSTDFDFIEVPNWTIDIKMGFPVKVKNNDGQCIIKFELDLWIEVGFLNGSSKYKLSGLFIYTVNTDKNNLLNEMYGEKAIKIRTEIIIEMFSKILELFSVVMQSPQLISLPNEIDVYNLARQLPYTNLQ
jgi:hypothetical protein